MTDPARTETASRSALLALEDERRVVRDGYEFLDEKRILLATEILRQRDAYREARRNLMAACRDANATLVNTAARHGLEMLQVLPIPTLAGEPVNATARPFIGQTLLSAEFRYDAQAPTRRPMLPSTDVDSTRDAFRDVLVAAAPLAAVTANLSRLLREYERTERRVRALENVVLPEIRTAMRTMEEHLDLNEQEEAVRVRSVRGDAGPAGGGADSADR